MDWRDYGDSAGRDVTGNNNVAMGFNSGSGTPADPLTASDTIAISSNSLAAGNGAIAMGAGAFAAGPGDIAIGQGAQVLADDSSAFGSGATVLAGHTNSTALGTGATTTRANQVMMGTSDTTYTMAGVASTDSKTAQTGGPTHVVTSNSGGDLAAYTFAELGLVDPADLTGIYQDLSAINRDLSAINNRLSNLDRRADENQSGVALAMAMQNPDLVGGERFGVAANYGNFEGASGLGATLMGVLGNNFITVNDRVAVSGGLGVGFDNGRGSNVYGGRVGLQWTR